MRYAHGYRGTYVEKDALDRMLPFKRLTPEQRTVLFDAVASGKLPLEKVAAIKWQIEWAATAREKQEPPDGDWTEWGLLAGRGFGKTLTGAHWLASDAYFDPQAFPSAVIAPTLNDVRHTCFEGPAGLLSIVPPELVLDYNKTNLIITILTENGKPAIVRGFSAEEPERLRGPQFARLWCFVAGTQVATPTGDRAIETLQPGDWVRTRKGPRQVVANSERRAAVGRVTFANGAELVGTADHPVYLKSGWTSLNQLQVGDEACAINAWSGADDAGTRTKVATTSAPTSLFCQNERFASIGRSGSQRAGRFLLGTTSTIGITTGPTTPSKIWSACQKARTAAITRWPNQFRERIGALWRTWFWPAPTAELSWSASGSPPSRDAAAATPLARRPSGRTLSEAAESAARSFGPALETSALSVASTWRPSGEQSVFCLKVEGEPEYFANGVLVHNCDELAAWTKGEETWDMAMMGLRLGPLPKVVWTTTPKPKDLVRKLVSEKSGRVITTGSTYENKDHLPKSFFEQLTQYEGTQLGRQELMGELIDAEEGGIIARNWFKLWPSAKALPSFDWIIMSLDTAFTEKTLNKRTFDADSSACTVWGVFWHDDKRQVLLLDCWAEQYGLPDLMKRVKKELTVAYGDDQDNALIKPMIGSAKMATSGRKPDILLIEDKGSGISLRQMLDREGITAYAYNPGRADKLTRLHMVSHIFARGQVWLPESEKNAGKPKTWIEPVLAQLCSFTGSGSIRHDDYVDSTTQAMRLMMDKNLLHNTPMPKRGAQEDEREERRPRVNPYAA
jgi:predicted phage terminase large subunit-like protein